MIPARVLRTFTRKAPSGSSKGRNLPIQAVGLALYEEVAGSSAETIGNQVVRTQWLDEGTFKRADIKAAAAGGGNGSASSSGSTSAASATSSSGLLGKNILIVDEVDDTRTTLQYAYNELLKDVREGLAALDEQSRKLLPPTRFGIFVVHNKVGNKGGKKGQLPLVPNQSEDMKLEDQEKDVDGVGKGVWYYAAEEVGPVWVDYPWESDDIVEHNRLSALAKKLGVNQGQPPSSS